MNEIYQTVLSELSRLNMMLPIQVDDEVLNEKAIIFSEDLANWSPRTIKIAFRDHGRVSRFMPTLSEIIEKCRTASQSLEYKRQRTNALPMPDRLTDEQARKNLERIKELKQRVFGRV